MQMQMPQNASYQEGLFRSIVTAYKFWSMCEVSRPPSRVAGSTPSRAYMSDVFFNLGEMHKLLVKSSPSDQVNSTVPPDLPSLASLACALSARLRLRLFAYSVAPLVSVPGEVTPLPAG